MRTDDTAFLQRYLPRLDYRWKGRRNLVFTYFAKHLQREILDKMLKKLKHPGFLIIGSHENLPDSIEKLYNAKNCRNIYLSA